MMVTDWCVTAGWAGGIGGGGGWSIWKSSGSIIERRWRPALSSLVLLPSSSASQLAPQTSGRPSWGMARRKRAWTASETLCAKATTSDSSMGEACTIALLQEMLVARRWVSTSIWWVTRPSASPIPTRRAVAPRAAEASSRARTTARQGMIVAKRKSPTGASAWPMGWKRASLRGR
jgi:hypothetical protein